MKAVNYCSTVRCEYHSSSSIRSCCRLMHGLQVEALCKSYRSRAHAGVSFASSCVSLFQCSVKSRHHHAVHPSIHHSRSASVQIHLSTARCVLYCFFTRQTWATCKDCKGKPWHAPTPHVHEEPNRHNRLEAKSAC